jgi:hypothetical protein
MQSRLGNFDVRGKTVEWEAMAMFHFENRKIAQEWVSAPHSPIRAEDVHAAFWYLFGAGGRLL